MPNASHNKKLDMILFVAHFAIGEARHTGSIGAHDAARRKPFVNGNIWSIDGVVQPWLGPSANVTSPIHDAATGGRLSIGTLAQLGEAESVAAVTAAARAWRGGQGEWPMMPLARRIERVEAVGVDTAAAVGALARRSGQFEPALELLMA